jgi:hypothetical protein
VAIYRRVLGDMFEFKCGGTLINERWMLSAAHCFQGLGQRSAADFLIVEDTNQIDNPRRRERGKGRALDVKRIVPHEGYRGDTSENDIALVELASPARSAAVALAGSSDPTLETAGKTVVVTGWGTIRPMRRVDGQAVDLLTSRPVQFGDPMYFTDRLMEVALPLVDIELCRQTYSDTAKVIDARNICAGLKEGGKDSCQGDSGGPVVARDERGRFVQVGIISGGKGCGLPNAYGVNTRVSAYEAWIRSTSGIGSAAPVTPPRPPDSAPPAPPPPMPVAAVAQDALSRDNPAGLTVEIVQGDVLRIGQSAQFRVTAKKPGYLLLIDMTPDGRMTQVFPNARSLATPMGKRTTANLIEPGRPLLVPDHRNPYEGFEMKVAAPTGRGLLVAVLTEQPLPSVSTPATPKTMERLDAIDFIAELAEEFDRDLAVQGPAPPRGWSIVMKPYRVDG